MPADVPIIPFTPKNLMNKEKDINKEFQNGEKKEKINEGNCNKDKEKVMKTMFVPTPIFINQMNKNSKNMYNKFQTRKMRPFTERIGDWICKNCRNLNFAFRLECNRCKLPKKDIIDNYKNVNDNVYNNLKNDSGLNNINNISYNYYKNSYQNKNKYKCKNQNNIYNDNTIFNLNKNKDCSNNNDDK